jgi:NADPH:quinone reductase-like Zn-dependent oxidoreductase
VHPTETSPRTQRRRQVRAALLTGHGGPARLVVHDDVTVPEPGPGSVLIAVSACGMNNTDINTRVGWYGATTEGATGEVEDGVTVDDVGWNGALRFPLIQGADICGTVVGVGLESDAALLGRRVLVDPWIRVNDDPLDTTASGYVGSECNGGFAEFACVPAANAHPVESALSDVELATFPCSGATALNMLRRVRVARGETVLITGASGGVGSLAVQIARALGARVIAVGAASKRQQLLALGADVVIAREESDLVEAVRSAARGSVDVVADVVGGAGQFAALLAVLRRRGRYVTAGAIAGPIVPLDLRTLYLNDLELHGVTSFEPRLFADLVGLIETGAIRPVLARVFPLDQIRAAQAFFVAKTHVGSIVISCAPPDENAALGRSGGSART